MKRTAIACSVASALAMMAVAPQAGAAGFALYEQGISGLGNAYAGNAALAEDATTVWWNPAGMSRLPSGKHFAAAGALIMPSWKFSDRGSQTAAAQTSLGGTGGDAGDTAFVPSLFFVTDINQQLNFGVGISVPFGLKTEYDSTWLGRFQGVKSEVKTININPAVSYKLSDAASIGFGINYQRGEIDLVTAANYSAAAAAAGNIALAGGAGVEGQNHTKVDGDAWGFNIGGLFQVAPTTRVGVHYRSSLAYKLDGTTSFSSVPAGFAAAPPLAARVSDGDVKINLKTPENIAVSGVHRLSDRVDLLGDVTWWRWSRIKQEDLERTSGSASGTAVNTLVFDFRDTWRLSAGVNYKMDGGWLLKAGLAYDQTPVKNAESRTVRLPDSDRYWLAVGAKYQVSRSGALDFGYSFIKARDADIHNDQAALGRGVVDGTYKAHVHVLGVQYQHTF